MIRRLVIDLSRTRLSVYCQILSLLWLSGIGHGLQSSELRVQVLKRIIKTLPVATHRLRRETLLAIWSALGGSTKCRHRGRGQLLCLYSSAGYNCAHPEARSDSARSGCRRWKLEPRSCPLRTAGNWAKLLPSRSNHRSCFLARSSFKIKCT